MLDTFPLVRFFRDEPGAAHVEALLEASRHGRAQLLMSEINAGELYYIVARKAGAARAERAIAGLELFRVEVIPTTWSLVLEAAQLKADFPLSYADCFALAVARRHQAAVVTGDPEFKRVEHLVSIEWI
ncbi:MAG: type II toxin-antitoxin system VapC family toxin [Candidatus Omnitrophica bacterium]|nr:type II toxin-antitoxin system VapC family toxin [Candidatus Omnitrophota bacterium]MBI3020818.1 type II toxin-antitoxin system VapC family toxin [Candidatus Omnitrophota bacterium]MBI3083586.1 type II toxin-antitoxin system VapC family toxin [Candidatus Omnitrophota bacterium]